MDLHILSLKDFITYEKIGEGSFGTVYLVEDKETKVKYALKKVMRCVRVD